MLAALSRCLIIHQTANYRDCLVIVLVLILLNLNKICCFRVSLPFRQDINVLIVYWRKVSNCL